MGEKLNEAKHAGQVVRMRITGTGVVVGFVTFVISSTLTLVASQAWLRQAAALPPAWGMMMMLAAVLPTDRRLLYRVARAGLFLAHFLAAVCVMQGVRASSEKQIAMCVEDWEVRWYCSPFVGIFWYANAFAVVLLSWVGALPILKLPPRTALDHAWKALGAMFIVLGLFYLLQVLVWVCAGVLQKSDRARAELPWTLIKFANYFFGGWAMASDRVHLRQRVQAALIAQGGQVSSAAGIAALMNGAHVHQVRETARKNFYATSFEELTFEDLADSTPNPDLFRLARRVNFGECDYFVSHSWRDPAPEKWRALQNARAAFVSEHNREPVRASARIFFALLVVHAARAASSRFVY